MPVQLSFQAYYPDDKYIHCAVHTICLDRRHSKCVFVVTIEHPHSCCPVVVIVFAFAVVALVAVVLLIIRGLLWSVASHAAMRYMR